MTEPQDIGLAVMAEFQQVPAGGAGQLRTSAPGCGERQSTRPGQRGGTRPAAGPGCPAASPAGRRRGRLLPGSAPNCPATCLPLRRHPPGMSSPDGGIEEFRLVRPCRRLRSAASARNSSTARTSSPISSSRAAHDAHPAAADGRSVTDHHDQGIPVMIKAARWASPGKIARPEAATQSARPECLQLRNVAYSRYSIAIISRIARLSGHNAAPPRLRILT